nr:hypothetical protein [Dendronalium sp. ChiSLP03b]MDZ8209558.1 hypothetical protein [Dendronalium sp. ChiSLP03b]
MLISVKIWAFFVKEKVKFWQGLTLTASIYGTSSKDKLTEDEQRDRLHLERKVERAFFEAGKALMELRDRRLYRATHKTFE